MKKLWLVALVFSLAACATTPTATPTPTSSGQAVTVLAEGRLQPLADIPLTFAAAGPVSEVLVREGDTVLPGQVLLTLALDPALSATLARAETELLTAQHALDNAQNAPANVRLRQAAQNELQLQQQLEQARDRLDTLQEERLDDPEDGPTLLEVNLAAAQVLTLEAQLAQAKADRATLEANKGLDTQAIAAAEARLRAAFAGVAAAQAALANLAVTAPTTGTIAALHVQPGQRVAPGQLAATWADLSGWVVETTDLTETEVVAVTVGQTVNVVFDALPERVFTGRVERIATRFVEQRGDVTYTVRVTLNDPDPSLRWGMTAALNFLP